MKQAGDCTLYEAIGRLYELEQNEKKRRNYQGEPTEKEHRYFEAIGNLLGVLTFNPDITSGSMSGANHDAILAILERIQKKF